MDGSEVLESVGLDANPATESESQPSAADTLASDPEFLAKFNDVFGFDTATGEAPVVDATADEVETPADEDGSDEVPAPVVPVVKKPVVKTPGKEVAAPAVSTLSPVLRQAASRNGWEQPDIDAFYTANPELAERTFEKLHGSYNQLSAQFAQIGMARLTAQAQNQPKAGEAPAAAPLDALFDDKALEAMRTEYGDGIVNKLIKPLQAEVGAFREAVQYVKNQRAEALAQTVNNALTGFAKELPDLYGDPKTPWGQLSPEAQDFRRQVVQYGDAIVAGYEAQNLKITHDEALARAHMALTSERRAEVERKNLTAAIKKRSASITQRPTQRRQQSAKSGTAESAMEAYAAKAAELGFETGE